MADCEQASIGRVIVVRLRGMFVTPEDIAVLKAALSRCLDADPPCVVVNWSGIEHLNSLAFGALIEFESALLKRGGNYRNCSLPKRCLELLRMLKIANFDWHIFRTEEEAVRSCPE